MEEITLSIMSRGPQTAEILTPLLQPFEERFSARVNIQILNWEAGWSSLTRMGLYQHGPDVSEIGATWICSLIAMNVLRYFSSEEIELLGDSDTFLPEAWKTCTLDGYPNIWSIPWLRDATIIHYRKDYLQRAGIDETQAFASPAQWLETIYTLRENGFILPLALPSQRDLELQLHVIASFVWGQGGEFVTPDGKQALFHQPEALTGIRQYFQLYRAQPPEGLNILEQVGLFNAFHNGTAASITAGQWLYPKTFQPHPKLLDNWGAVRLPGVPFVGGSNLVIWKHSRQPELALQLIRHLIDTEVCANYGQKIGYFPARTQAHSHTPFLIPVIDRAMMDTFSVGRTFPVVPLWGMIEERFTSALAEVWQRMQGNPEDALDDILQPVLNRAAEDLNETLELG